MDKIPLWAALSMKKRNVWKFIVFWDVKYSQSANWEIRLDLPTVYSWVGLKMRIQAWNLITFSPLKKEENSNDKKVGQSATFTFVPDTHGKNSPLIRELFALKSCFMDFSSNSRLEDMLLWNTAENFASETVLKNGAIKYSSKI